MQPPFESSVNSDGTQTLRQRRRAAAVPIDLQTAVRTAVQRLREQWLCRFLLSANIFYILLWKKERKGAIITHISAYDAFCADISHYDRYNRAVMLSPLFARSGSIQPFSLPCISRLCDFSDTLKISDIFNVFRNNSRIHIKAILRRSCMSVESHSPKGSNLCQMYARGVVYRHFR